MEEFLQACVPYRKSLFGRIARHSVRNNVAPGLIFESLMRTLEGVIGGSQGLIAVAASSSV
ncbi:hypothetical protein FHS25_000248 [Rhizobium laguerreae]|uniref:Uncharacterized protein n=1 Tax=Rhizobium laguerreae TaxID=1076926 RepID=A0AAX2QSQ5_9HYPH|nr:hypothetical protein [Rhizobium laguerreae]TCU29716.1 hypothetical protein EV131_101198 [Rhizobium laguerreae]